MEMIITSFQPNSSSGNMCMNGRGCNGYDPDVHMCSPYCNLDGLCALDIDVCFIQCFCLING